MADKINIKIDDNRTIRIPAGTEMTPRLLSSLIAKHKELVTKEEAGMEAGQPDRAELRKIHFRHLHRILPRHPGKVDRQRRGE